MEQGDAGKDQGPAMYERGTRSPDAEMVPLSGSCGVNWALSSFSMFSRISHRMPENPCKRVLIRTSIAARVVLTGRVLPEFTTPAFKNLATREDEVEQPFSQNSLQSYDSEIRFRLLTITLVKIVEISILNSIDSFHTLYYRYNLSYI